MLDLEIIDRGDITILLKYKYLLPSEVVEQLKAEVIMRDNMKETLQEAVNGFKKIKKGVLR